MDKPTPHIESDAEYRAAAARAWYECASVNPDNPMAVAQQIEAAFKALERCVNAMDATAEVENTSVMDGLIEESRAILAAAKEA